MKKPFHTMKKPPRLKPGDTIGVVAPAGPYDEALFDKGVASLESMGYRVFLPEGLSLRNGFLAGPDAHRAGLINRMFADTKIDAVFCARGGYGSLRILAQIDWGAIRENPKIFLGFSDITALLAVMVTRSGLVGFHGPVMTTIGQGDADTRAGLVAALTSAEKIEVSSADALTVSGGRCTGRVIGGNLATLCHLVGTPFMPDLAGCIVLLEDVAEPPYKIDRMLTHMHMAGCFDNIAGMALGTFLDCGEPREVVAIVGDRFKDAGIPILAGLDIGHGPVNRTIPLGVPAVLDTDARKLSFLEGGVT